MPTRASPCQGWRTAGARRPSRAVPGPGFRGPDRRPGTRGVPLSRACRANPPAGRRGPGRGDHGSGPQMAHLHRLLQGDPEPVALRGDGRGPHPGHCGGSEPPDGCLEKGDRQAGVVRLGVPVGEPPAQRVPAQPRERDGQLLAGEPAVPVRSPPLSQPVVHRQSGSEAKGKEGSRGQPPRKVQQSSSAKSGMTKSRSE